MTVTDQMERTLHLNHPPQRIVSLVPSQTELLYDLGLDEQVVGLTTFCIHPDHWFRHKKRVGGTKKIHIDRIADLGPDLIIGNKEENTKTDIETLASHWPVWMSDIHTLPDALDMIKKVGQVCHRPRQARALSDRIQEAFRQIPPAADRPPRVLYLIWRKPYMAVARNTFIDDMLTQAGFRNALSGQERYPELTEENIQQANPDAIFLSSEPYPFREKHIETLTQICPTASIHLVNGELFSWYGSRLQYAPPYFCELRKSIEKI